MENPNLAALQMVMMLCQVELPRLHHKRMLDLFFLAVFGEAEVLLSLPSLQLVLEDSLLVLLELQRITPRPPKAGDAAPAVAAPAAAQAGTGPAHTVRPRGGRGQEGQEHNYQLLRPGR